MKIQLSPSLVTNILVLVILINLLMLAGTWGFHHYYYNVLEADWESGSSIKYVLLEFSIGTENTMATWYSTMLFLSISFMSFLCYRIPREGLPSREKKYIRYGWMLFLLVFLVLSFDEMSSIHERLGNLPQLNPFGDDPPGWIPLLGLPIGIISLLMLAFSRVQFKRDARAASFAVAGILLLCSIPFQEHIELTEWSEAADMDTWQRPVHLLLLEEGSELFGATGILAATLLFALQGTGTSRKIPGSSGNLRLSIGRKSLLRAGTAVLLLGLGIVILDQAPYLEAEGDIGVLLNWLASAPAYLVGLLSLVFLFSGSRSNSRRYSYGLLAFFSLLLSAYFGSNLYDYFNWLLGDHIRSLFTIPSFLMAILVGTLLLIHVRGAYRRTGIGLWTLLILWAILGHHSFSPVLAFVAFLILLLILSEQATTLDLERSAARRNERGKKT